jgi:hypothetical protein
VAGPDHLDFQYSPYNPDRVTSPASPNGRLEGDYIVWRDENGDILKWSTVDSDTTFQPLSWVQNQSGMLVGSGPDGFSSPEDAKNQLQVWYETDSPEWQATRKQAIASGLDVDDEDLYRLLAAGIDFTQVPGSGTTDPFDIVNTRSGAEIIEGPNRGGAAYGPYRYESTDVALSSESQALEILDQAYQQYLGRVATGEEAQAFKEALNMMEQMNPAKSVIEGVSGQRSDSRTQTTEGGFNPRAFAREYTMASPEYANTFAATTFMNALNSFLDEPNAVEQRIEGINA